MFKVFHNINERRNKKRTLSNAIKQNKNLIVTFKKSDAGKFEIIDPKFFIVNQELLDTIEIIKIQKTNIP
jgi:hypothetical protein